MKQIEFAFAGPPEEVVRYAEAEAPAAPGPDDVLIKVLAFPINPADLLTMQGIYPGIYRVHHATPLRSSIADWTNCPPTAGC